MKNTDIYDIIIINRQAAEDGADIIEEKAQGTYRQKNGKTYIMYETAEDGAVTRSTLIISGNEVKIKRNGSVSSDMLLKENEKTNFIYKLPYGETEIEAETLSVENGLNADGGVLRMIYNLNIQGGIFHNDITIKINKR